LRRNDITPNSLGAELSGVAPSKSGKNIYEIIEGIKTGKIKALFVMEDDPVAAYSELESLFSKLDLLIVHATNYNKTTQLADIVFPAATFAEKNGTMVNFKRVIQRLRPATSTIELDRSLNGMSMSRLDKFGTKFDKWAQSTKRDARPSWKILTGLAAALGTKYKYQIAEDVFEELASAVDAFRGINYDDIGEIGIKIKKEFTAVEKV